MKSHPSEKCGFAPRRRFPARAWLPLVLTPLLLPLVAGCHRDEVKVYRVAKDQDQPQQQTAPALPTDSPNPSLPPGHPDISSASATPLPAASASALPQLTWKTPEGWTEMPPSEMRVASFKATGPDGKSADVSVIPLPGLAGSDPANVNRWRGQVGLSPVSPDELKKSAEAVEAAGQPAQLYDVAGQNPGNGEAERILGVIQHRDDMAWFFKITGDAGLVEQQKPAFVAFLKSLNFSAAPAQATLPQGHPAIGDMGMGASPAAAPVSGEGKPNWQVPAGWQEMPAAQFLLAEYAIAGANGAKAEVNVASLSGDGGGMLANVNRWRRQIGLGAVDENGLAGMTTSMDVTGGRATLVDWNGTDGRTGQPTRLIGVVVPMNGQTWFYKLMGDAKVVESQKAAFTQFVQGVKY